ncbi:MAG: histidine kinase N-terminal 7TM domain-containing protein [Anaerolineales bacterium]
MFKLTPIAIVLLSTTAINFVISSISWKRRKTRGGLYFALGMFGATLWTLAAALGYAAVELNLKIFFAKIESIGYNSALSLFVFFAMYYAGLDEWADKKWLKTLIFLLPISNILLITTNELHGWIWTSFSPVENNIVVFKHGPGFVWVTVTGYLMIASMLVILWLASRKGSEISRRQSRMLLYAGIFPVIANIFYLYNIKGTEGVDWSSVTFSVTGILFLRALYGARLLDLVPVARDKLFSSLSDGMVVLDMQNRIIDINQAAADIIVSTPVLLLGKDFKSVTPFAKSFLEEPPEQELKTELGVGFPNKLYFDVLISPLREGPKKIIGRLITFRNITERKENELRLLQLTQAVEQSPSSVIITDLKGKITYVNPQFSILTGYATNEAIGNNPNIIQSGLTPDEHYKDMWRTIKERKTWRGEFLNKKKNGELYWEHVVIAPVLNHEGKIINFIAIKEDVTERKHAEEALEQRFLEIQELNKNLHEAQAQLVEQQRTLAMVEERQRLGRDMHDSVNQSIHSLILYSETLIAMLEKRKSKEANRIAERLQESGRQALKEIRLLIYETQAILITENMDLVRMLEDRLNMVERRVGIRGQVIYSDGSVERHPSAWNENLYWMIMEALNNSLKHAKARNVNIIFNCTEKILNLEIVDDGAGFDLSRVQFGGLGMQTMRERAELVGGQIHVESSPGHGTHIYFKAELNGDLQ